MRSGSAATAFLLVAALMGAWAAPPLSTATAAETDHTLDSPACDKEQFRLKFGAQPTYTLLTAPLKPAIQNGFVVAKVSYLSACRGGRSAFSASFQTKANMEIVLLSRKEPECDQGDRLSVPVEHSEVVSVPLPAEASSGKKYLAFPPDGEYELWLLTEADSVDKEIGPDFMHAAQELDGKEKLVRDIANPVVAQ